jgi:hypothetical protein
MGFVKLEETPRPDRAIHLDGARVMWPPAGCISSSEAARRIGITDEQLRAKRTAKDMQDRGPMWLTAPNRHHVAYTPQSVRDYVKARAERLKAQADALLARIAEPEAEPSS